MLDTDDLADLLEQVGASGTPVRVALGQGAIDPTHVIDGAAIRPDGLVLWAEPVEDDNQRPVGGATLAQWMRSGEEWGDLLAESADTLDELNRVIAEQERAAYIVYTQHTYATAALAPLYERRRQLLEGS